MSEFDLVLSGGQVVLPHPDQGHLQTVSGLSIGVLDGRIAKISSSLLRGKAQLDLKGLHVLPGVIDSQVHFREPGLTHKEDFESGTKGALLGGVTSVFEMPNTKPPTTDRTTFSEKIKMAEGRAWVNFAFYIGGGADNVENLGFLENLAGCPGVKVFMGSSTGHLLVEDDSTLEQILRNTRKRLVVHAEDEFILRERRALAEKAAAASFHPEWRNVSSALSATKRLVNLARRLNRKVHVLHVSSAEEMEFLAANKDVASVEVLPQHLTFFAPDIYEKLGSRAQQNPPIREKRHLDGLWKAIREDVVDVIGSDHAPHTLEEKARSYPQSPSGMPMVQTLVPLMLNHVNEGRLNLEKFVQLVGENPRSLFGCYTKGRIEEGLDADFTIVDMKKQRRVENRWIVSKCGWSPLDGVTLTGWPQSTIIGGKVCMQEDQILTTPQGTRISFNRE